jgi:hypothetical protein
MREHSRSALFTAILLVWNLTIWMEEFGTSRPFTPLLGTLVPRGDQLFHQNVG